MGDDVGWLQPRRLSSGHDGRGGRRTWTSSRPRACCSPTTMPKRVARRAGQASSPAKFRCGPRLTTVGQAGADVGMPDKACNNRDGGLGELGYATGQFGKNHLGGLNKFLPTLHGFERVLRVPVSPRRHVGSVLVLFPERSGVGSPRQSRARGPSCIRGRRMGRTTRPSSRGGEDRQAEDRRRRSAGTIPRHVQRAEHAACRFSKAKYDMGAFDEVLVGRRPTSWTRPRGREAILRLAQHHAHARGGVPSPQYQATMNRRSLRPRGSWHVPARRQRRCASKHLDEMGREGEHHRRLHDRQRCRGSSRGPMAA